MSRKIDSEEVTRRRVADLEAQSPPTGILIEIGFKQPTVCDQSRVRNRYNS